MNTYDNNKVIYLDKVVKKKYKTDLEPILYMLIGIPCSGKSTYAEKNCTRLNAEIVSSDDIRLELKGDYKFSLQDNKRIFEIAYDRIENTLRRGKNVIFDATNTNKKYRQRYITLARKFEAQIIAIVFNTPFHICVQRNEEREKNRKIPINNLRFYTRANLNIKKDEGFDDVKFIKSY